MTPGLEQEIVDQNVYDRNVEQLHSLGLVLPKSQSWLIRLTCYRPKRLR